MNEENQERWTDEPPPLSNNAENAQEKDLVLRQWMQDVTSLLCYQPEVPYAHKESLVKALDHYIKLNNHQCQKPPNNPSPL